jgi:hypothetical protein
MPSKRIISYVALPFLLAALQTPAQCEAYAASRAQSFAVGADGYGVDDCIVASADCAKRVADAFCEAHGHTASKSFGPTSGGVFISCE